MGTPLPTKPGTARASLLLHLGTPAELLSAQLHPLGSFLLAGAESGDVLLFAISTGGLVQRFGEPSKSPTAATCVAWAELGGAERIVAGHKSGTVRVWDVESGAVLASLPAHRADVGALACMPTLYLLATGSTDTNIKLWSLADLAGDGSSNKGSSAGRPVPLQVLKGHAHPITQLEFTPDGELLISGDAGGGLRVWQVAGGAQGRLLHDLSGQHTAAITGIDCHPEERLFATCSLDRTLRAWDMDAQAGRCVGVHGPEGRREVRALAFTSTGSALLAAYPDGLRTFTLDPLEHQDTADVQWKQVTSIRYTDGKAIGVSLHKGDAGLFCVDLTRMRPFASASRAAGRERSSLSEAGRSGTASAESSLEELGAALASKLRFTEKHQVAGSAAGPHSATIPAASQPAGIIPAVWAAAAAGLVAGSAPSAVPPPPPTQTPSLQRRLSAVLGPKAVNSAAAVEVFAPPRRPAELASFNAASHSRPSGQPMAATGAADTLRRAPSSGSSGSDGKSSGRQRLSAEENGHSGEALAGSAAASKAAASGKSAAVASWEHQLQPATSVSMLGGSSHLGFLAAEQQRSQLLCGTLQTKLRLWREVKFALQRGDLREAVRLMRDGADLCVTANVVISQALHRQPDRFTLDLCTEAAPLARQLLASGCTWHHQAALQLLDAILGRWGGYMRDVLSNASRLGKVDLELERRQERSRALRGGLLELAPALERLSVPLGGGRAQQMLVRLRAL